MMVLIMSSFSFPLGSLWVSNYTYARSSVKTRPLWKYRHSEVVLNPVKLTVKIINLTSWERKLIVEKLARKAESIQQSTFSMNWQSVNGIVTSWSPEVVTCCTLYQAFCIVFSAQEVDRYPESLSQYQIVKLPWDCHLQPQQVIYQNYWYLLC